MKPMKKICTKVITTKQVIELTEDDLETILRAHFNMPSGVFEFEPGGGDYLASFTLTEVKTHNTDDI